MREIQRRGRESEKGQSNSGRKKERKTGLRYIEKWKERVEREKERGRELKRWREREEE